MIMTLHHAIIIVISTVISIAIYCNF